MKSQPESAEDGASKGTSDDPASPDVGSDTAVLTAAPSAEMPPARTGYPVRTPTAWWRDLVQAEPLQRWLSVAGVICVVLAFGLVLVAFGVLPGHLPDPVDFYSGSGVATCTAQNFPAHLFSCPDIAYPAGYRAPFGQPVLWVSGFVQWLGVDPVNGTRFTWFVGLLVGFWGARRLLARVTDIGWLAWVGVVCYLVAPIVSNQGGYGALQIGFILVPSYLLVDLRLAEGLSARLGTRAIVWRAAAVVVVRTIALMMDPYSFFIAAVGVVVIWLAWAVRLLLRRHIRLVAIGAGIVLLSFLVAYFVYSRSVDTGSFPSEPLDRFRGSAIDVYGLVVPSSSVWWALITGLHHNVGPLQAYNDGHNLYDVYLGIPLVALALVGLVVGGRNGIAKGVRVVAGVAGVIVLALAIGPSLRIADFRQISPSADVTYDMPASAATVATPWSWVYQNVPGISSMRAVWRWELGVRLAVIVLAVLALSWWVKKSRSWRTRWIPVVVAVVIVIESIGNLPAWLGRYQDYLGDARAVETLVTTPLAQLVHPGERAILYGPGGVSPGSNDYMANFICSAAELQCYNTGGDKALISALKKMPKIASGILLNHIKLGDAGVQKAVAQMFASGQLDVLVLVNFSLAAQAANWPPTESVRQSAVTAGQRMFTDTTKFTKTNTPFITVIRPKK